MRVSVARYALAFCAVALGFANVCGGSRDPAAASEGQNTAKEAANVRAIAAKNGPEAAMAFLRAWRVDVQVKLDTVNKEMVQKQVELDALGEKAVLARQQISALEGAAPVAGDDEETAAMRRKVAQLRRDLQAAESELRGKVANQPRTESVRKDLDALERKAQEVRERYRQLESRRAELSQDLFETHRQEMAIRSGAKGRDEAPVPGAVK